MVSAWPARDPSDARALDECLWLYSPTSGLVTVWHNEGVHPAETLTLVDLRRFRSEPDLEAGYAYRGVAPDAWRLTTDDHEPVTDPAAARAILDALVRADRDGVRPPPPATGGWDDLRLQPSRLPPAEYVRQNFARQRAAVDVLLGGNQGVPRTEAEDVVACRAAVLELARTPAAEPPATDLRVLEAALAGVVEDWRARRAGWVRTTAATIHAIARSGALGAAGGATAFFLAHQILWDAGYGAATPDDDVELARHIAGTMDGTVAVDATEALLLERLGPNP